MQYPGVFFPSLHNPFMRSLSETIAFGSGGSRQSGTSHPAVHLQKNPRYQLCRWHIDLSCNIEHSAELFLCSLRIPDKPEKLCALLMSFKDTGMK
jgi:hypothetical protein